MEITSGEENNFPSFQIDVSRVLTEAKQSKIGI